MNVTITMNDNPKMLKIFKEIAKGFNEPIKIKKNKNKLDDFYNSKEFLDSIKEVKELKAAYLRGEIKGQSFEEFKAEMEKL
ncbi:hypothetical protein AVANS_1823 [Campylobacter sp. RM5004]|uniref:hypothetical protein n=1 Tax=Campylobacter sp. RM5004 TaxID=1660078 RepID=UPI001EFC23AB|nr:hypothetical protein [Campylobacter sp. RM5004]ULO02424.1 hypothetical protein AVANS_1823 [Campylobacter sp. RM5004]